MNCKQLHALVSDKEKMILNFHFCSFSCSFLISTARVHKKEKKHIF